MTDPKKTPLYEAHRSLGAKMVEFAGFLMPVSYRSIIEEHTAVRQRAGLFDVSHMGEFLVTGEGALDFVNAAITNDCSPLLPGGLQYTVMCRENGTVVDDLLVFVLARDRVMLVVNASNIDKDFEHLSTFDRKRVELRNASDDYALVAVQGPRAREVLVSCGLFSRFRDEIETLAYYNGLRMEHDGEEILVSRTGYTGEIGFEIFVSPRLADRLWADLMAAGRPHGIAPVGLGARDTLRFEASYCLYGHELDDSTSPLEAGLGWVVKLKKNRFRGLEALKQEKSRGPKRTLVGLELEGRNIARQGYAVLGGDGDIGRVTSGTFSPTLEKSLAMALIDTAAMSTTGTYGVRIRDKTVPAGLTPLPFYKSRAK
jgi:aminomethyltransferase